MPHFMLWLRYSWLGLVVASVASSCLDALYEDNSPLPSAKRYAVCCKNDRVDTCACSVERTCAYEILACSGGRCASISTSGPPATCPQSILDAGQGWDGGFPDSGFPGDGGAADGGLITDGGWPTDGGVPADGGSGPRYAPCCQNGKVTTCACFDLSCPSPFTPCANATCIPDTAEGSCS